MGSRFIEIKTGDDHKVKQLVHESRPVLILYYMTTCPHCQTLKPTWEKVKNKLKKNDDIAVAEVEYSNMSDMPLNLRQIRGFPTIQMLDHGKVKQEYFGDRSMSSIAEFAMQHVKPKPKAKPKTKPKPRAVRNT